MRTDGLLETQSCVLLLNHTLLFLYLKPHSQLYCYFRVHIFNYECSYRDLSVWLIACVWIPIERHPQWQLTHGQTLDAKCCQLAPCSTFITAVCIEMVLTTAPSHWVHTRILWRLLFALPGQPTDRTGHGSRKETAPDPHQNIGHKTGQSERVPEKKQKKHHTFKSEDPPFYRTSGNYSGIGLNQTQSSAGVSNTF